MYKQEYKKKFSEVTLNTLVVTAMIAYYPSLIWFGLHLSRGFYKNIMWIEIFQLFIFGVPILIKALRDRFEVFKRCAIILICIGALFSLLVLSAVLLSSFEARLILNIILITFTLFTIYIIWMGISFSTLGIIARDLSDERRRKLAEIKQKEEVKPDYSKMLKPKPTNIKVQPPDYNRPYEYKKAMEELHKLIGLNELKADIERFAANMEIGRCKREVGIMQTQNTMHMVFSGAPGTGKTTVARIMGKMLYGLGYLTSGHVVEVSRDGLISGYVGHTAIKVKEVLEQAKGGVLFIDEAYSLQPRSDNGFEQEAIDTLVKYMEDYRENLVVIFAGYEDERRKFIKSNTGLKSRVPYFFNFKPYNAQELMQIALDGLLSKGYLIFGDDVKELSRQIEELAPLVADSNARAMRNFIQALEEEQNFRLSQLGTCKKEALKTITSSDISKAAQRMAINAMY